MGGHEMSTNVSKAVSQNRFKINGRVRSTLERIRNNWEIYVLAIPFVLWYMMFAYKPMLGLVIAFQDFSIFKGISGSEWVGLANFIEFFKSPSFLRVLKNTLLINFWGLLIGFPLPIIFALMLNEVKNKYFKNTIQTFAFLPHFISVVVVAGIVTTFLSPSNGLVNIILAKFGFDKIYFLTKPEWFRTIFIGMGVWKETGFSAIIYLAALAGIDPHLYEAARVDGASKFQQLVNVTIPSILPTIMIMLILRVGKMLEVGFEKVLLLYQPSTYKTADVISTYVFRTGLSEGRYDMATAVGLFNAIVAIVLVFSANKISKKLTESSLW